MLLQTAKKELLVRCKKAVVESIDQRRRDFIEISREIHACPELCFEEFKASELLGDYLDTCGFTVTRGICELETAFEACLGTSGPRIAIIAEYDALAGIGHGCGHNLIAAAAAAAGVGLAAVTGELGGTVTVFGTPAEELGGNGKEIMSRRGAFKALDAAMMIHPWNRDMLCDSGTMVAINIEYHGKTAHPCTPAQGINALDAMLVGYGAFNNFRQVLLQRGSREEALWGGIIKSGDDPGRVPDHTTAFALPIAADDIALKTLIAKVHECFRAGESATAARLEFSYDWENRYRAVRSNPVLSSLFDANMKTIRTTWKPSSPVSIIERAATDMGSISQIVPAIHPWIAYVGPDTGMHSVDSAAAAVSDEGHAVMLDGAKAMAMSAVDLLVSPELLERAWVSIEK